MTETVLLECCSTELLELMPQDFTDSSHRFLFLCYFQLIRDHVFIIGKCISLLLRNYSHLLLIKCHKSQVLNENLNVKVIIVIQ